VPEDQIRKSIEQAAEKLRITHLLTRKTVQLSGGEMQRVAIGRAIVRRPRVFLMDEPLSNLDAKLRESLRAELKHLQKVEGVTTLYVTHDQIEALTMADRIGVLDHGKLIQVGTPEDIYDRPTNIFVAKLVGTPRINLLPVERQNGDWNITGLEININLTETNTLPDSFLLGIRPEDVSLNPSGEYPGEIELSEPLGVETIVHIKSGTAEITCLAHGLVQLKHGDMVRFDINKNHLHYFDEQENRI
jgi:ABC-type sugar transport system ATPase subunit